MLKNRASTSRGPLGRTMPGGKSRLGTDEGRYGAAEPWKWQIAPMSVRPLETGTICSSCHPATVCSVN